MTCSEGVVEENDCFSGGLQSSSALVATQLIDSHLDTGNRNITILPPSIRYSLDLHLNQLFLLRKPIHDIYTDSRSKPLLTLNLSRLRHLQRLSILVSPRHIGNMRH